MPIASLALVPSRSTSTVTLAEYELSIPELAARYAQAIGEPVDVTPPVAKRAVAIFATDDSWSNVVDACGTAVGFRLVRANGKLRFENHRAASMQDVEVKSTAAIMKRLAVPDDVIALAAQRKSAQTELNSIYKRDAVPVGTPLPKNPRRDELSKFISDTQVVESPASLVLGRYLARGRRLPLGVVVPIETKGLIGNAELNATANQEVTTDASLLRVIARHEPGVVKLAWVIGRGRPDEAWVVGGGNSAELKSTQSKLQSFNLRRPEFVSPWFARDWGVADYVAMLHRTTDRTTAGPALRMALGEQRRFNNALPYEPWSFGFEFKQQNRSLVVSGPDYPGPWPSEFDRFDHSPRFDAETYAQAAKSIAPESPAGLFGMTLLGNTDMRPLDQYLKFFRFLGKMSSNDRARLLKGEVVTGGEMTDASFAAYLEYAGLQFLHNYLDPPQRNGLSMALQDSISPITRYRLRNGSTLDKSPDDLFPLPGGGHEVVTTTPALLHRAGFSARVLLEGGGSRGGWSSIEFVTDDVAPSDTKKPGG